MLLLVAASLDLNIITLIKNYLCTKLVVSKDPIVCCFEHNMIKFPITLE